MSAVVITCAVLIVLCSVLLALSLVLLIRNEKVAAYRRNLIAKVGEAAYRDIEEGKDYKWRWEEYEKVHYFEMAFKFWKPLDSFYTDKSFTK